MTLLLIGSLLLAASCASAMLRKIADDRAKHARFVHLYEAGIIDIDGKPIPWRDRASS